MHQHRTALSMRHEETGQWFLESPEFQQWKDGEGQTLFCPGIPGSGKTTLTSIVIANLLSEHPDLNTGIAFIYLDYTQQAKQSLENLLAVILRQLGSKGGSVARCVRELYHSHKPTQTSSRPTSKNLFDALEMVIPTFQKVFLVVDALDECSSPNPRDDFLFHLSKLRGRYGVNVFVTSRPDPKIVSAHRDSISKEIIAAPEDIQKSLEHELLRKYPALVGENQQLLGEVKLCVLEYADGMYVYCTKSLIIILIVEQVPRSATFHESPQR